MENLLSELSSKLTSQETAIQKLHTTVTDLDNRYKEKIDGLVQTFTQLVTDVKSSLEPRNVPIERLSRQIDDGFRRLYDEKLSHLREETDRANQQKDFVQDQMVRTLADVVTGFDSVKNLPHLIVEKFDLTNQQVQGNLENIKKENEKTESMFETSKTLIEKSFTEVNKTLENVRQKQGTSEKRMKEMNVKILEIDDNVIGINYDFLPKIKDTLTKVTELQETTNQIAGIEDDQTGRVSLRDVTKEISQSTQALTDEIKKVSRTAEENIEKTNDAVAEVLEHIANDFKPMIDCKEEIFEHLKENQKNSTDLLKEKMAVVMKNMQKTEQNITSVFLNTSVEVNEARKEADEFVKNKLREVLDSSNKGKEAVSKMFKDVLHQVDQGRKQSEQIIRGDVATVLKNVNSIPAHVTNVGNSIKDKVTMEKKDSDKRIGNQETKIINCVERVGREAKSKVAESNEEQTNQLNVFIDEQLQFGIRDLYDVVEKEAQILRDYSQTTYKDKRTQFNFYFKVRDFKRRKKSGVQVYSPPWYIEKFNTCLRGYVKFKFDGDLSIMILPGRRPQLVGLPCKSEYKYKHKVSVVNEDSDKEKMLKSNDLTYTWDEKEGKLYREWGYNIDTVSCETLEKDGFIEKDVLLLKYAISIVE